MNMMHAALLALLMLEQTQNMNARAIQSGNGEQVVQNRDDLAKDEEEFCQNFGEDPDANLAELVSNLAIDIRRFEF